MKDLLLSAVVGLILFSPKVMRAQEVTLIAPGGMRCPINKIAPEFEKATGHAVQATIGSGGGTHKQIVAGEPFDVPIVQPPYQDVINSGNVIASTETPLATVPMMVVVRKGNPRPDISTPEAVKKALLAARFISYPDGANGAGGAAGVSFDATQRQLGIYDEMKPKIKRIQGVSLMKLVTNGDIDMAITFASEIGDNPDVDVVGQLPRSISTPTALVGFVSAHAISPDTARALLKFLSGPEAAADYKVCGMTPGK